MQFAEKMKYFDHNIFSKLEKKRTEIEKNGRPVIDLSVGTPDLPPDPCVMDALAEAAHQPENLKYSLGDTPQLIEAVQGWYDRRYGVPLGKDQITSVYGSQEGLAHIAFPLINPGDIAIIPTPSYPVFAFGPLLAGAQIHEAPLLEKNDYLIDLEAIPEDVAKKARMIVVSYPNNPVTATAPPEFYEKLVDWAKTYNVAVISDVAYADLVLDGDPAPSFLATPGAMDVGVEFNSLSKAYNLTGLRIAFAVGNREIMDQFMKVRSQIDYGTSFPTQIAAAAALNGPQDVVISNRAEYKKRAEALCGSLRSVGWNVENPKATMFVWAKVPEGMGTSFEFVETLLEKAGVLAVPGSAFGNAGEGYVRLALVRPAEVLTEAAERIDASGILKKA